MNIARLKKKGWSEQEIDHLKHILYQAEALRGPWLRAVEHALFWVLVLVIVLGGVAFSLKILPLLVLGSKAYTIPIIFVIGTCLGLLFVQALHDLRLEQTHQHAGVIVLLLATVASVTLITHTFFGRLDAGTGSALIVALTFSAGIIVPYLTHWRTAHEAA